MPSLFDPRVRAAIQDRISRLTPDRKPAWGRLTAPEMVCHVSCDLRQGWPHFWTELGREEHKHHLRQFGV